METNNRGCVFRIAGIGYTLGFRRCYAYECSSRYEGLLRKTEVRGKVMRLVGMIQSINPVILIGISSVFGALATYFIKSVMQSHAMYKIANATIKTHVLIHHKYETDELIKSGIVEYSKEVNYKFEQAEKNIISEIKLLESKIKNAGN